MKEKSRWLALQLWVVNFFDNMPVIAWGCFSLVAGMACWHAWAIILPILALAEPEQPVYHFVMATLCTAVVLFIGYCRVHRLEIVLTLPSNLNTVLHAHDGPISPEFLEILTDAAEEHGVKGKFEAYLAQYDTASLPSTKVVYNMLITLAEEAAHEKPH